MARSSSKIGRGPRGRRANGIYLAIALVALAVIVLIIYRGRDTSQDATAGEPAREGDPVEALLASTTPSASESESALEPEVAGEPDPAPASVDSEPAPRPAEPVQSPPVGPVVSDQVPTPVAAPVEVPAGENPWQNPVPAVPPAEAQVAARVDGALAMLNGQPGKIIEVRNKLNEALRVAKAPPLRLRIKKEMAELADQWLFGPAVFATDTLCSAYTVQRGDLLQVIGRRHKVPYQILMQINNIPRPQSLQAGKTIKIINGPFHAKVYRSAFTMDLYLQDTYVRSFKVGLGRPGHETPTGLWRVKENGKLVKPKWTDPDTLRVYTASDPDYPLGSRWIALEGMAGNAKGRTGFAIHGTKDPEQIGTAGSRGCIRMFNGEAILAYRVLVPVYSTVEVFD
jgi:lipoprotein-anchoring transpeptidase ErfK/SrfK